MEEGLLGTKKKSSKMGDSEFTKKTPKHMPLRDKLILGPIDKYTVYSKHRVYI